MSTAHLSKYDGRCVFLSDRTNYWLIMTVIAVNNRGWCFLSPHTQWQVDQQKTLNWSSRYFGVLGLELKNKLLKAMNELRINSRVGNFLFPCRSCSTATGLRLGESNPLTRCSVCKLAKLDSIDSDLQSRLKIIHLLWHWLGKYFR